ncbi:6535_t:CDS:2, partial [Funneliformis geosporum]
INQEFEEIGEKIKAKENQLKDTPPKNTKKIKELENEIGDATKGLKKAQKIKAGEVANLQKNEQERVKDLEKKTKQQTAELTYQKEYSQDQKKKYLWEIGIKNKTI